MEFKVVGILLIVILTIGGIQGCTNTHIEDEILVYLEEKYKEDFVIENFNKASILTSQNGGDYGIAHPNSNKDIAFNVGTIDSQEGGYYDNYNIAKFVYELDDEIKSIVHYNLGDNTDCKLFIYSLGDKEYSDISAKEYLNIEKDNTRLSLDLGIEIESIDDINKYYQGIYNVFEELKLYDTAIYDITVGFVDDINDRENQEYLRLAGASNLMWGDVDAKVYGQIILTYLDGIESVTDIEEQLEILYTD